MSWEVEFLNETVRREFIAMPPELQAGFLRVAEMLKTLGPHRVGFPHVRPIGRGLSEMRFHGPQGIARGIYCQPPGGRIVVLHLFVKKSRQTPKSAIALALRRMKEMR